MPIRSIIIDDEVHNLENLNRLLSKNCPNIDVIAMVSSAKEGIEAIINLQPDLVFLDIEMPHKNGFDLLESIDHINFEVIFITAFNKYVLRAIKSCALDYIMKPVAINELKEAVLRVTKVISEKKENQKLKDSNIKVLPIKQAENSNHQILQVHSSSLFCSFFSIIGLLFLASVE